ncbi:MAG: bifunctional tRNA (5-methylaminomethyl-2-thiouridine)(34)-methyltransferase MnmD/FAD-dependent 5-carboxymethylaminomethyl-2-thiouridine(34) oxidoreductase MnmC [Pseudomonadota bacterium]
MPAPLIRARLALTADGTPFSEEFGDVYHSAAGGPAQAAHVFLGGNGLPERWRGRRSFTILETGFGLGLNFLVTWKAWRDDPLRCERLHFVSIEKHPFSEADLALFYKDFPEAGAKPFLAQYPMLVPGMHRIELDGVVLTLFFADIGELGELDLAADAIYLDGFAPAKNPEMWAAPVLKRLGRLAAPGATAATWSVAAPVRAGLEAAGWKVEKRKGFGSKREMLCASLIRKKEIQSTSRQRSAIVIGAGIAGASVCERLCARGWEVTLLERAGAPAAPGRHAGVFHPVVTRDDSLFARLTRAGFLHALRHWGGLEGLAWERCGVLQLARDEREDAAQRAAMAALGLPGEYARTLEREAASARAGVPLAAGGFWFPSGGWLRPFSLIRALLARAGNRLDARFGCDVARIAHENGAWSAFDRAGKALARAPVCVLANAAGALELAPSRSIRMRRVRGQITFLPAAAFAAPRVVLLRGGFVLPALEGESIAGASYDFDDPDPEPRPCSHAGNLERLARIIPGAGAGLNPAALEGMVGFRAVAPDRLPLIGAMPDEAGFEARQQRLDSMPAIAGLYGAFGYGSRGLLWAGLGAELLASLLEGEPLPLERRLVAALAPGRFVLRESRKKPTAARA